MIEPIIIEAEADQVKYEDGGCAAIVEVDDYCRQSQGLWVRLHSWSDSPDKTHEERHPILSQLGGKRVRITIEEIK